MLFKTEQVLSSHQSVASFCFSDNNTAGPWSFISVCWAQPSHRGSAEDCNCTKPNWTDFTPTFGAAKGSIKHTGEWSRVLIFLRALQRDEHLLIVSCTRQIVLCGVCPGPEKSLWPLLLTSTGSYLAFGGFCVGETGGKDCQDLNSSISCKWTNEYVRIAFFSTVWWSRSGAQRSLCPSMP